MFYNNQIKGTQLYIFDTGISKILNFIKLKQMTFLTFKKYFTLHNVGYLYNHFWQGGGVEGRVD